jgi:hypothetical protein
MGCGDAVPVGERDGGTGDGAPDAVCFRLVHEGENARRSAKVADQALPGLGQFLGKDPGLRDDREKAAVP